MVKHLEHKARQAKPVVCWSQLILTPGSHSALLPHLCINGIIPQLEIGHSINIFTWQVLKYYIRAFYFLYFFFPVTSTPLHVYNMILLMMLNQLKVRDLLKIQKIFQPECRHIGFKYSMEQSKQLEPSISQVLNEYIFYIFTRQAKDEETFISSHLGITLISPIHLL